MSVSFGGVFVEGSRLSQGFYDGNGNDDGGNGPHAQQQQQQGGAPGGRSAASGGGRASSSSFGPRLSWGLSRILILDVPFDVRLAPDEPLIFVYDGYRSPEFY